MKKAQGFTLVELLVVIVIIGILATGSISMFTGAQQKARDAVRVTDIQAIKMAVEQAYGDNAVYPAQSSAGLNVLLTNKYIDKLPNDPKSEQQAGTGCLVYAYGAAKDQGTSVAGQEFELSTMFENTGNQNTKSANSADGGNDNQRWETGTNVDYVVSTAVPNAGSCDAPAMGNNDYDADGTVDDAAFEIDSII